MTIETTSKLTLQPSQELLNEISSLAADAVDWGQYHFPMQFIDPEDKNRLLTLLAGGLPELTAPFTLSNRSDVSRTSGTFPIIELVMQPTGGLITFVKKGVALYIIPCVLSGDNTPLILCLNKKDHPRVFCKARTYVLIKEATEGVSAGDTKTITSLSHTKAA